MKTLLPFLLAVFLINTTTAQNSMIGDGFGGRLWYSPTNYTVGSYSGYSICYDDNSQLYGWGNNNTNQLGLGLATLGVNIPTPIPNMTNVKYFSTGYIMGAIKNDNTGWAWGNGITGNPIQVISDAYFVDASSGTISFVKNDGTVWSIGDNSDGQFGNGLIGFSTTIPIQMQTITNAIRVANNLYATIVLLDDSSLWSTGNNWVGSLGVGQMTLDTLIPIPITSLPKIVDIKSNTMGTIALSSNGDVYFWGEDYCTGTVYYLPTIIPSLSNIVAISGCDDGYHFMALDANKNCYAWAENSGGQCGLPSSTWCITTPQLIATDVIDIMAGETFSYIVKSNGNLFATGYSLSVPGSSIWLNLSDIQRESFTQLDPSLVPGACPVVGSNITENDLDTSGIIFPNVFSPNNDDENDAFYFPNIGLTDINCKIFNRWGTLIYEWNQLEQSWDGRTTTGKECTEGTYFYILNYKMADLDWERKTGYVTLFR